MAKTPTRKVKRALPDANLYLEDIEEILYIYRSAYEEVAPGNSCDFYYEVGDNLRMDSVEDLKEHGGYVVDLSILMSRSPSREDGTLGICGPSLSELDSRNLSIRGNLKSAHGNCKVNY